MKQILIKYIFVILFLVFCLLQPIYAWKSVAPTNHIPMTNKALTLISESEYPDIKRFGSDIADWSSGFTDDEAAHGKFNDPEIGFIGNSNAMDFNGGPFKKWWEGVNVKYKKFNF